jgi:hypothetical protein
MGKKTDAKLEKVISDVASIRHMVERLKDTLKNYCDFIEHMQNDIVQLHHRTAATQRVLDDHRRAEAIAILESGKWDPCNAPQTVTPETNSTRKKA